MGYLLDTCVMIWILHGEKLSPFVEKQFLTEENPMFLSHISIWEMAIKDAKKGLGFKDPIRKLIERECRKRNIDLLPLELEDYFGAAGLPMHHRDPFDRMLIAQAKRHKLTFLTPDKHIHKYNARISW